jgi:Rod binding domain-containing protein
MGAVIMQPGSIHLGAATGKAGSPLSPKLVQAAHEFEAQMMKELLQPMTGKDALTGEDADSGGDAGATGALGEFASQALGQALSRAGGFGIANRILQDLSHSGTRSGTGKVSGDLHSNPAMKTNK